MEEELTDSSTLSGIREHMTHLGNKMDHLKETVKEHIAKDKQYYIHEEGNKMEDSSGLIAAILAHPAVQEVLAQSQPVQKFSLTDLSEDEYVFMIAYRSFLATEYGNPYVGMASKFSRYLQSEVDKARS